MDQIAADMPAKRKASFDGSSAKRLKGDEDIRTNSEAECDLEDDSDSDDASDGGEARELTPSLSQSVWS